MNEERLEFYDPLYETITFEKGLPSTREWSALVEDRSPIDPRDLIKCTEFARLAFLRQVGLAWLVLPSATHTRFSHSIGCWWLGKFAESLIKVRYDSSDETFSLSHWLKMTHLREEFYLGLLFHDIGHGPLSHVLEHNEEFNKALIEAGVERTEHEYRGAYLLERKGPISDVWKEISCERYGDKNSAKTFHQIPWESFSKTVSISSVCYLMTADEKYISNLNEKEKTNIRVVKELVSGVLDLDRMDHYARDSYFSGLKQVTINVRGFLSNLRLTVDEKNDKKPILSLTNYGASYAASLLFNKRQILSTMFRNPQSVSYHTMVNWALTKYLQNLPDKETTKRHALRIALMEDDQFIETLGNSSHLGCKYMIRRIRSLQPYSFVCKVSYNHIISNLTKIDLNKLKKNIINYLDQNILNDDSPSIIIHFDNNFWERGRPRESQDWLDTERLVLDDNPNIFLKDHPEYKNDFESLRDSGKEKYMWIYSKENNNIEKVKKEITKIINGLN